MSNEHRHFCFKLSIDKVTHLCGHLIIQMQDPIQRRDLRVDRAVVQHLREHAHHGLQLQPRARGVRGGVRRGVPGRGGRGVAGGLRGVGAHQLGELEVDCGRGLADACVLTM